MAGNTLIADVTADSFEELVLERSFDLPILVDFWAPWCGPCQTLGPLLEKVVQEEKGAVALAKINTEIEQGLAQHFRIQGIPAVKVFRDGKEVDQFTGLLPEAALREFVTNLLPSAAGKWSKDGEYHLFTGDLNLAENAFKEALNEEALHPGALLGMARIRMRSGAFEEAEAYLNKVPLTATEYADAQRERSQVGMYRRLEEVIPREEAEELLQVDPTDANAAYAMGVYWTTSGRHAEGLEHFLMAMKSSSLGEQPRQAMLDVFEILGSQHELTRLYRSQLAAFLY